MQKSIRGMAVGAALATSMGLAVPAAHAAPVAAPAAATSATSTSTAARRGPSRDQRWERALVKEVNAYRAKKKLGRVVLSSCLSKAVQPLAARSAKAGRAVPRTKADGKLLAACAPPRKTIDAQFVWGPSRSATSTASVAAKVGRGKFYDRRQKLVGVATYRDSKGRRWVALVQAYTR